METLWPLRAGLSLSTVTRLELHSRNILGGRAGTNGDCDMTGPPSPGGGRTGRTSACVLPTMERRTTAARWRNTWGTVSHSSTSTGQNVISNTDLVYTHQIQWHHNDIIGSSPEPTCVLVRTTCLRWWASEYSCMLTSPPPYGSPTSWSESPWAGWPL